MHDKIETLLSQMNLEEKISLLAGADFWTSVPIERLGIPQIKVTDGPNGARGAESRMGPPSASFPVGVALASTWNTELVKEVGQALADEVKAKGAHILLAPTVNIHRSPLAGRNFECYSEDPYLTSRLAVAYIQGLQSQGVGACVKHFVCNDSEFERMSISSEVTERALREIYLPPFKAAVQEAQTWAVMSSYNKVNGTYASENPYLLLDILKGEWGFDGIVISDWHGTYSPAVAKGGLDLEMPGPARWMGEKSLEAVKAGQVSETMIDDKVRRLLRTITKVGAFDHPKLLPEQAIDRSEHRQLIRQVAGEAIVLLKNRDSLLPLDPQKVKSIALIGENALRAQFQGGGSSRITPHYVVSPLEGIKPKLDSSVTLGYELGCPIHKRPPLLDPNWMTTTDKTQKGFTLTFYDNQDLEGEPVHTQVTDLAGLAWWGSSVPHVDADNFSLRLSGILTPPETGTYLFYLMSAGFGRLMIDGETLIDHWEHPHPEVGVESSMELELTAGQSYDLAVEYSSKGTSHWREVHLGGILKPFSDSIQRAVDLAANSEVAIVFAGLTEEWESEGFDRPNMELPGEQNKLIQAVAAANPNTIVVLNTGSPIHMDWLDQVPALVQAWYTGQEGGNAIADVLFGEVNPSGKLPTSFPKRLQDNPAYLNYPGENGKVHYGEGIFVGYRYYDKKDIEPLFPFGYGLSYTTFEYQNLELDKVLYGPGETIRVSLEVTNCGNRPGKEIVQLYLRDEESSLVRPEKELKAFAKLALEPGETQKITFELDQNALSFYDDGQKAWITESGTFQVLVGSSSRDIRLKTRFEWQIGEAPEAEQPARLHSGLTLGELLNDEHGRAVLKEHLGDMVDHPMLEMGLPMTLDTIAGFVPEILTAEKLEEINQDLANCAD